MEQINFKQQHGFSLPEVLIAILLFSISLLGLAEYQKVILQGFHRQWQLREAWGLAQQNIEILANAGTTNVILPQPKQGWKYSTSSTRIDGDCLQLKAIVITPQKQRAELNRWLCPKRGTNMPPNLLYF